jgi:hypothetical protein
VNGTSPAALMSRAGHSDFKTTQLYIDLAGETFPGGRGSARTSALEQFFVLADSLVLA